MGFEKTATFDIARLTLYETKYNQKRLVSVLLPSVLTSEELSSLKNFDALLYVVDAVQARSDVIYLQVVDAHITSITKPMTTNVGGVPDQPQSEHETDQVSQNQKKEERAKKKRMKERSDVWEHIVKEDLPSGRQSDDIGKEIEKCLLDWGLQKVMCITVDNASSNDTAIGYMRWKMNGWKTGVLNGRFIHMRCAAHIINLVVSDGFIKQSPARLQRFKKYVLDEKINTKKGLCLDVPTRWNSTYLMLNTAIELEDAFERYSEKDPHYVIDLDERDGKGSHDSDDWNNMRRFSEFLQAFYDLTLHVSGSLYVTSKLFTHKLVSVAVLLKDLVSSDDLDMCLMACRMKEKYEKYWGDPEKINLLIFIVVVLDPRYKLDYVEWMITEIYDPIVASKLVSEGSFECFV
ncbi:zinc finger BED domain-containing protein RICESLEEPER 2-like [Chenopodium quinoa]|uniref:zinc finger BED domain-containing protein RICESLEEPER 2-like n=1 Tax=Chenopodium quinoa TaxID=63459 RepID=UPI000B77282E|nr:zinc finger BED domain-containing protein RICESLEEPER 2-like [Chenopodium quinoa]